MPLHQPITTDQLLAEIRRLGLIAQPGRSDVLAASAETQITAEVFAAQMVDRGSLTPFQVEQLLAGQGDRLVLRQYVMLDRIGAGGMGQVFRARHRVLDRIDAIKVIRPGCLMGDEAVMRFRREAQLAARCTHPNLVPVYDADEVNGVHFLAMEYVPGIDLHRLVRREGPLDWGRACEFIRQAALGLHHAHQHGMVHRDVKPANLMLAGDRVRVLDLGLARLREPEVTEPGDTPLTGSHLLLGTPDYLPPEQFRDARSADSRSDVYALGCTMYFLLTGRPPFVGGSNGEKFLRHQAERPTPIGELCPNLPHALAALIEQMLEKDPGRRPATAAEVADRLVPFASTAMKAEESAACPTFDTGVAPSFVPPLSERTFVVPASAGPRRRRRFYLAGTVAVAFAVALIIWIWPRGTPGIGVNTPQIEPPAPNTPQIEPLAPIARKWQQRLQKQTHGVAGYALAVLPPGRFLVVVSGDSNEPAKAAEVRLWDVAEDKFLWQAALASNARCVAATKDGQRFAVGTGDWKENVGGQISTWEVEGWVRRDFTAHDGGVLSLSFAPNNGLLVSGGRDGRIRVWDLSGAGDPNRLADRSAHPGGVTALASDRSGTLLASGGADGVVTLWKGEHWNQAETLPGGAGKNVRGLAFADEGRLLVAALEAGANGIAELRFWSVSDRKALATVPIPHGAVDRPFLTLHLAADGRTLFIAGEEQWKGGIVWLYDAVTRKLLGFLQPPVADRAFTNWAKVYSVATSPDGRFLATSGDDANLNLWEPEK